MASHIFSIAAKIIFSGRLDRLTQKSEDIFFARKSAASNIFYCFFTKEREKIPDDVVAKKD